VSVCYDGFSLHISDESKDKLSLVRPSTVSKADSMLSLLIVVVHVENCVYFLADIFINVAVC